MSKIKVVRVEYILNGKPEFSLYDAECFSIKESIRQVKELLPEIQILKAFVCEEILPIGDL